MPEAVKVLVVDDDDPAVGAVLQDVVLTMRPPAQMGPYDVTHARFAGQVPQVLAEGEFDLILMDLQLQDGDGLLLIERIRRALLTPIIVVTARQSTADKVLALKLGADDFVPKPFDVYELEARAAAVLRRSAAYGKPGSSPKPGDPDPPLVLAGLVISHARGPVISGARVHLTPNEFRLTYLLVQHAHELVTREFIGQELWGYTDRELGHVVDVHVNRLRAKLKPHPQAPLIVTARGRGYVMTDPSDPLLPEGA